MKGCVQRFPLPTHAAAKAVALACCLAGGALAQEQTLVLPPGTQDRAGDFAFDVWKGGDVRFQQFYSSGALRSAMPTGAYITGISFRQDDKRGFNGELSFASVEVLLSTTDRSYASSSSTFVDNLGSDATLVSSLSPVRWTIRHSPGVANAFQMPVRFSTPFLYDPRKGNLLIDVTLTSASHDITLDFSSRSSSSTDIAWAVWARPGDPPQWGSDLNVGYVFGDAFVIRLDFIPVPEPCGATLLCVGLPVLIFFLRRSHGNCIMRI